MLNIITGRTGSGKTRYIRNLAKEIAQRESGKAIIIVPEQFSFDTEKGMLDLLGNKKADSIEVLSFSRLAERLLLDNGKITKAPADDSTRAVLMSLAIESLQDKITFYGKYRKNPALISELLEFNREIKTCCISNGELAEMSEKVKKPVFSKKLSELSMIFQCYDNLTAQKFQDDSRYLDILADLLLDVPYFDGKTVFVDGFSGFSAQEYKVLERIISSAENVYVTFCCDTEKNNGRYELFYNAVTEIKKLKAIAARSNIKIAPEKVLRSAKEYKADALNFLEANIFAVGDERYEKSCDCITVIPCRNKVEECDFVASEIKRLVRERNYRYRDIAVIERSSGTYKNQLLSSFRKYNIDCFSDNRQPILTQPLMIFMLSLFDILSDGFYTENVLRFLKTGLYGFSVEEISMLEEYALVWQIKSGEWKKDWTGNPDGFGVEFNEASKEALNKINDLRRKIVGPIITLKNSITDADGETISRELFLFLRRAKIDENLKTFTSLLAAGGENDLAAEQGRIWKILTEILDSLCSATGETPITLQRYRELFEIIVSTKSLGEIPNGLDEVIIGSASRIKATAPKAVFIVGANTGVFPAFSSSGVLLNDAERCELQENGIDIVSNLEYNSVTENFIAYHSSTLATDRLYVSYSLVNIDSTAMTPSELVLEIERMFPNVNVIKPDTLSKIESRKTAFSAFAKEKNENTVLGSTLHKYFEIDGSARELSMMEKISKTDFAIKDKELSTELFGKNMYISASKTEKFYKCPFRYFCEYGIKAKPRREAQLDPAQTGTLVHEILEKFLKENSRDELLKLGSDEIHKKIDVIVDNYVEEKLSGYADKSNSFLRAVNLIKESSFKIVIQLVDEFSHCKFIPVNFELSINNDGDIKPYLIELENGGTVKIIGSVDRVDAYKTEDNTFIRVIDYKTGGKEFKLYDIFGGLNMQMLIYLFAIWQNGGEMYENVTPAGILYFQAKAPRVSEDSKINRYSDIEVIKEKQKNKFKMSGMVLNNTDVISAMEKDMQGIYIPAGVDKKGNLCGNVISVDSLKRLKDKVNGLIRNMAYKLQNGEINAFPVKDGCDYCEYADVCRRDDTSPVREITPIPFNTAVTMLGGDDVGLD